MKPIKPTDTPSASSRKLFYYPLLGLGLAFLMGWFYLMRQLQVMEWLAQFGPASHKGSLNMLAIMVWMIPALLVWKYYLRWLNRRFSIGGQHDQDRHDAMYQNDPAANSNPERPNETREP